MRSMARAKPTAEITCLADGDTAQVRAHAQHDEPFGLLDAVGVLLWVAEDGHAMAADVIRPIWLLGDLGGGKCTENVEYG